MMIMLKAQVKKLVDFELEMANKEHGERFNSAHESIELLKEKYELAKNLEFVRRPTSWALYHTRQEVDRKEKGRK